MPDEYDIKGMVEIVQALKQAVNELKQISGGIVTVERNTARMLASLRILELNICDVADIYNHTHRLSMEGKGQGQIDKDLAIVSSIYDKYDADAQSRWNLYADTAEMLKALRHKGFQLGVVSNIGRASLDAAIKRLRLAHLVAVVISRNEVTQLKPDPGGGRAGCRARRIYLYWRFPQRRRRR